MKVITIGRSSGNDVCINDPYVGRQHCQIMQYDDGTYAIVDMGSTNGTFVNGGRIFGVSRLQPYDTVTIGQTTLPWTSYFTSVIPSSNSPKNSMALPITLSITGGMLLLVVVAIVCFGFFRQGSAKVFAFKGEYPDAVVVNMVDEDGTQYSIEAIEGQVCVWFEEGVTYKTAQKSIKASGGRIVAQIPENGYYLVEVPADKVNIFLNRIKKEHFVDWAYPNMVSYSCMAKNYVLDNFYPDKSKKSNDDTPHGVIVEYAMQECGSRSPLDTFNIGTKNGKSMKTTPKWRVPMSSTDNLAFATSAIASSYDTGPIIINMSFGSYLRQRKDSISYYWEEATVEEKKDYQKRYLNSIRIILENVRKLKDKDYIIVKSAGNNGVKEFDAAIISYLRKQLRPDELEIMDKHFVIVAAGEEDRVKHYSEIEKSYKNKYDEAVRKKDSIEIIHYDTCWRNAKDYVHFVKTYSNEMESGRYDPWVTKVDISDFEYKGKNRYGTSFAAPRAACILSSVANEMNLTGTEVLKLAREVTKRDGELTKEALLNAAKENALKPKKEATIEGVLRMYIVNNTYDGMDGYGANGKSNVGAFKNPDVSSLCYRVDDYHETDNVNNYLAFVVETEKPVNVTPYLDEEEKDGLGKLDYSAFMVVPKFQYSQRDFALKYANKKVRVSGTFYLVLAGWRHATVVEMDMGKIMLCETGSTPPLKPIQSLVGTKWKCIHDKNNREKRVYTIFEFVSSHDCNVTIRYQDFDKEDKFSIKFDYSSAEKKGCFKDPTGFYGECFEYDNNTLTIELMYKERYHYKREAYVFNRIK